VSPASREPAPSRLAFRASRRAGRQAAPQKRSKLGRSLPALTYAPPGKVLHSLTHSPMNLHWGGRNWQGDSRKPQPNPAPQLSPLRNPSPLLDSLSLFLIPGLTRDGLTIVLILPAQCGRQEEESARKLLFPALPSFVAGASQVGVMLTCSHWTHPLGVASLPLGFWWQLSGKQPAGA
jgi:hypothetical protein